MDKSPDQKTQTFLLKGKTWKQNPWIARGYAPSEKSMISAFIVLYRGPSLAQTQLQTYADHPTKRGSGSSPTTSTSESRSPSHAEHQLPRNLARMKSFGILPR